MRTNTSPHLTRTSDVQGVLVTTKCLEPVFALTLALVLALLPLLVVGPCMMLALLYQAFHPRIQLNVTTRWSWLESQSAPVVVVTRDRGARCKTRDGAAALLPRRARNAEAIATMTQNAADLSSAFNEVVSNQFLVALEPESPGTITVTLLQTAPHP